VEKVFIISGGIVPNMYCSEQVFISAVVLNSGASSKHALIIVDVLNSGASVC
jgi:hypothetical protein